MLHITVPFRPQVETMGLRSIGKYSQAIFVKSDTAIHFANDCNIYYSTLKRPKLSSDERFSFNHQDSYAYNEVCKLNGPHLWSDCILRLAKEDCVAQRRS
jgi:hypothetical protein